MKEAEQLGEQCTKTSKAIYAFLSRQATRSDEPKVVAEYRQKFNARVHNLCLDLIVGGLSSTKGLKNVVKPAVSVDDIQWIARGLSVLGESYSAERLAKHYARAMDELNARDDTKTVVAASIPKRDKAKILKTIESGYEWRSWLSSPGLVSTIRAIRIQNVKGWADKARGAYYGAGCPQGVSILPESEEQRLLNNDECLAVVNAHLRMLHSLLGESTETSV